MATAKDFRLYTAANGRDRLKIHASVALVRGRLAGRLAVSALRGRLHYFEITTADGTQHFWGIPE